METTTAPDVAPEVAQDIPASNSAPAEITGVFIEKMSTMEIRSSQDIAAKVEQFLVEVVPEARSEDGLKDLFAGVGSGVVSLWWVRNVADGARVGMLAGMTAMSGMSGCKVMFMVGLRLWRTVGPEMLAVAFTETLEKYARIEGCKKIEFLVERGENFDTMKEMGRLVGCQEMRLFIKEL
jgi:hypothetical protein